MSNILIVDDDDTIRELLKLIFQEAGYSVHMAATAGDSLALLNSRGKIDLAILDLKLGETDGISLLKELKKMDPDIEILIMTGYGSVETAVEAMKLGAFDYITKPFDTGEILLTARRALDTHELKEEVRNLRKQVSSSFGFSSIIGKSTQMLHIVEQASIFARSDASILIEGESGTGKDLLARAMHVNSERAKKPFIPINCAALPEHLFESELFGHKKGAFTGAVSDKKGLLEEADGGSCFFDEIGEMPLSTQVKLLRVLQDGEIRRVGSNVSKKIDIRVISATNQKLKEKIKSGEFREDLFYRLNVIPILIPPLRERPDDIVPLGEYFLKIFSQKQGKSIEGFSEQAVDQLLKYRWPGNVREVKNVIERAVLLCSSGVIEPKHLILFEHQKGSGQEEKMNMEKIPTIKELEARHIEKAIHLCNGNRAKAAEILGIGRNTLWRKLKELGIE